MVARIPSLNWLRVFEAAARTGSFARAAEHLNMSPPAVSQQIKALETHLGRALFQRGPHSVTLTEAGRSFLPTVAQSLHSVEVATTSLFGSRRGQHLSLRCSLLMACGWLAPRLTAFQEAQPDIRVSLLSGIDDQDFATKGADLAITFGMPPGPHEDGDLLFGEELSPVAPPHIAGQIETPADLARWPLIEISTHRANWMGFLPPDGADPVFTYTDTTLAAFALAAAGAIALDRGPATGDLAARFGLVPCLPGVTRPGVQSYMLVYPARSALGRPARLFRDWLLEEAGGT